MDHQSDSIFLRFAKFGPSWMRSGKAKNLKTLATKEPFIFQYYFGPSNTNTVRSFNYNGGNGYHLANQNQNICVRYTTTLISPSAFSNFYSVISGETEERAAYAGLLSAKSTLWCQVQLISFGPFTNFRKRHNSFFRKRQKHGQNHLGLLWLRRRRPEYGRLRLRHDSWGLKGGHGRRNH